MLLLVPLLILEIVGPDLQVYFVQQHLGPHTQTPQKTPAKIRQQSQSGGWREPPEFSPGQQSAPWSRSVLRTWQSSLFFLWLCLWRQRPETAGRPALYLPQNYGCCTELPGTHRHLTPFHTEVLADVVQRCHGALAGDTIIQIIQNQHLHPSVLRGSCSRFDILTVWFLILLHYQDGKTQRTCRSSNIPSDTGQHWILWQRFLYKYICNFVSKYTSFLQ